MADEETEKTPETETTPEPAAATPEPADATPEPQAAAATPEPDTPEEAALEPAVPTQPAAVPAQPVEVLTPKERRARRRAGKAAKRTVRAAMTPEERNAERVADRARKAVLRRKERERSRAKHKAAAHERVPTAAREHEPGSQKTRQGVVVSDRADKTITVRIDVARRHRRYEKIVRTSTKLHVHDEANDAHVGDTVVVRECRPLSRSKRWRLVEVLERAR